MNKICKNCGLTFGSHYARSYTDRPYNMCPGHEGRMDWEQSGGTVFKDSGEVREVKVGTPALNILKEIPLPNDSDSEQQKDTAT